VIVKDNEIYVIVG